MTRIDDLDLNLFDFDYDLTFMVLFLDAEEKVYARYGGRDATDADSRQSLAGLHYTMELVLRTHGRPEKAFAPKSREAPRFLRDLARAGGPGRGGFGRGCLHCHQVKEILHANLRQAGTWTRDLAWRYPLPENLGLELEVDRGNVVKNVQAGSAAAAANLQVGDVLRRLNNIPIHSFADAQFALDRAPQVGSTEVVWQRGERILTGKLLLAEGWRKTDPSWRPSLRHQIASVRLYGVDLTAAEKQALGLPAKQLAFRQRDAVPRQARSAGIRGGDIILGVDDKRLETDVDGLAEHVRSNYLVGDRVTVNLLRDGKRMSLPMTLLR